MNRNITLIVVVIMILSTIGGYFVINDDESTNEIDEPSQFSRWDVHFASSDSDLPECEWMTWGRLYYVENSNQFQVCKTVGWEEIQIIGPAGNDGLNGSIGDQGQPGNDGITTLIRILSSSSCPSGGNSFEIGPDNNGDGLLDITEVEVNVDICNGSDGIQGIQGIPGLNGTDGQDGTNGLDGQDGTNGLDGQDGTQGIPGVNGTDGQDGAQGPQGIPGVNGTDGQDGINGTDGQDGAQGPQGIPGVNGTDGLNALVSMTNESAGSNCANGGVRIDVGVDDNQDGNLSVNEIDQTTYVCDGGSTINTLLSQLSAVNSTLCDAGGMKLSYGLDNGDGGGNPANGILENGEIDYMVTHCSRYSIGLFFDINIGGSSGQTAHYTENVVTNNSLLFFFASDGVHGLELWRTNGTANGTFMVKDINNGSNNAFPPNQERYIIAHGSIVYFTAEDSTNGLELWRSDGTSSGTYMLKDINPNADSTPKYLTSFGSSIVFTADDGSNGREIWISDGTTSGTSMLKDIRGGSNGGVDVNPCFTVIGSTMYFAAQDENGPSSSGDLWKTDGTTSGTVKIKDMNGMSCGAISNEWESVGNTLYFSYGGDLWKSSGSSSSTSIVYDSSGSGNPQHLTSIGPDLYFSLYTSSHGRELWKTDVISSGTTRITDFSGTDGFIVTNYNTKPVVIGSTMYFVADSTGFNDNHLWKTEGNLTTTTLVKSINIGQDSEVENLQVINGKLYFKAKDRSTGVNLWESDGTTLGTKMLTGKLGHGGSDNNCNPSIVAMLGSNIYFFMDSNNHGRELFFDGAVTTDILYS